MKSMNTIFIINPDLTHHSAISALSSVTELSNLAVVYNRHRVIRPGLRHQGHLLPLSVEGVELKDFIIEGETAIIVFTA